MEPAFVLSAGTMGVAPVVRSYIVKLKLCGENKIQDLFRIQNYLAQNGFTIVKLDPP
jgi:hypothetical protein